MTGHWLRAVVVALLATLGLGQAAAQSCPAPSSISDIQARLDAAEAGYSGLDVAGYTQAMDEAAIMLPCLDEPVTTELVARYHRLQGLRLFVEKARDQAVLAFAAARALDPQYEFPDELVPPGHALRTDYVAADPQSVHLRRVPEPVEGEIAFDTLAGTREPLDRPVLVQVFDGEGHVVATRYVLPGDPLPPYEGIPVRYWYKQPRTWIAAGSGLALAASAGFYLAARSSRTKFDELDSERTLDELETLRRSTNTSFIVSGATAGLAALGVTAVVAIHW